MVQQFAACIRLLNFFDLAVQLNDAMQRKAARLRDGSSSCHTWASRSCDASSPARQLLYRPHPLEHRLIQICSLLGRGTRPSHGKVNSRKCMMISACCLMLPRTNTSHTFEGYLYLLISLGGSAGQLLNSLFPPFR